MPRNPKVFISNRTYDVCFRTIEGLPMVATAYMKAIIEGILVKALALYNITLCHGTLMSNHPHLVVVVKDPEALHKFVCYLKRESSHAINNLLGREQYPVWQAGYDASLILDTEKAIERIVYQYLNPARANLEKSIELYPNLNTWGSFLSGGSNLSAKRIPREIIPDLPKRRLSFMEQEQLASNLLEKATEENSARIEPNAWIATMIDAEGQDVESLKDEVIRRVTEEENRLAALRKRPVIGATELARQDIRKVHHPAKRGRKTLCLSSFGDLRKQVITWMKAYFKDWIRKKSELSPLYRLSNMPPGLFSPGGVLRANLNPQLLPF